MNSFANLFEKNDIFGLKGVYKDGQLNSVSITVGITSFNIDLHGGVIIKGGEFSIEDSSGRTGKINSDVNGDIYSQSGVKILDTNASTFSGDIISSNGNVILNHIDETFNGNILADDGDIIIDTDTKNINAGSITLTDDLIGVGNIAFSGDLSILGNASIEGPIINNSTPTESNHVVTKNYVDNFLQQTEWLEAVRVASIANVDISSVGGSIDGIALALDDRVLLKDQTDLTENGIYVYNDGSDNLIRASDFIGTKSSGCTVSVEEGSTNEGTSWTVSGTGEREVGVDDITWIYVQLGSKAGDGLESISGVMSVVAGNGIEVGTDVRVIAGTGITVDGSGVSVNIGGVLDISGGEIILNYGNGLHPIGVSEPYILEVSIGNGLDFNTNDVVVKPYNGIIVDSSGISVKPYNGIIVDSSGISVKPYNGIIVDSSGISVVANDGIFVDSSGVGVIAGTGITVDSSGVGVIAGTGITVDSSGVSVNTTVDLTWTGKHTFDRIVKNYQILNDADLTDPSGVEITHNLVFIDGDGSSSTYITNFIINIDIGETILFLIRSENDVNGTINGGDILADSVAEYSEFTIDIYGYLKIMYTDGYYSILNYDNVVFA